MLWESIRDKLNGTFWPKVGGWGGGGAERARCGAAVCGEVGRGEVIAEIGRGWAWCGG